MSIDRNILRQSWFALQRTTLHVVLTLVAIVQPAIAGNDHIPSILADRDDGSFWIAAERVVGSDGKLNLKALGRLSSSVADHVARKHARPRSSSNSGHPAKWPELEGCESYLGRMPDHYEPTSSLAELTAHAAFIVSGRVVAIRQGFLGGMPGSLLLLSTDYLKGDSANESYLFYPLARIQTAEGPICAMPVGHFVPPAIGDRFLVFSMVEPYRLEGRTVFVVNTARELVHEPRNGPLQLPASLAFLTAPAKPRFDDVVGAARDAVRTDLR